MRRRFALIPLVLVAAGCGHVRTAPADLDETPPLVAHTAITGARPAEQRVLRGLLAGMTPTHLRAVHVGSNSIAVVRGSSIREGWEADLLANMYAARAGKHGLRPVARVIALGHGAVPGVEPDPPRVDLEAVRALVRRSGASVLELRRQGLGVALTVQADDVAHFLKHHGRALAHMFQSRNGLEAVYVGIADRHGTIVYTWAWLPAEGMFWARPDLDACGPISHWGAYARSPKPHCPAA